MPFIPHTEAEISEMLGAIGAPSIDALFEEIPASLRIKSLAAIPDALTEMEVGRLMYERAQADGRPLNFLGAGAYEHHIPAAVWAIVTRGEFYSAYTPYQAEASQGTLQLLYEYQTMMSRLTGMEVSNASLVRRRVRVGGSLFDVGARASQVEVGSHHRAGVVESDLSVGVARDHGRPEPQLRSAAV